MHVLLIITNIALIGIVAYYDPLQHSNSGAWCAEHTESASNNQEQYIQVDLKLPIKIAKVGSQGQASLISSNWVTFYKFNYSEDGRTWKQYSKVNGIHRRKM